MGKKVLVVGQGGREHALVWKLSQSPEVEKIYAAPGNPGIAELAECINIKADAIDQLLDFADKHKIDLTVVGPELPLMAGIVDRFREKGLRIFGPTASAARLEGSKIFAKNLLKKYGIPTAGFESFTDIDKALEYIRNFTEQGKTVVIKADGLAAGKGVTVATTWEEASEAVNYMMKSRAFGEAGAKIVVEDFLQGEEVSFFAISDGKNYVPLISAQDHKQVYDDDKGPNTGGMGAYVNPPVFTPGLYFQVLKEVIEPVIEAMAREGCPYQGVLYAGLMITEEGPKVLEFNARFGDPETQAIMPMIKGDLLPVLEKAAQGNLENTTVEMADGSCICVVLASQGYPGSYEKGQLIEGLERRNKDTLIFQAGTVLQDGQLVTNGGRVLSVVCTGTDINGAIKRAYDEIKKIHFSNMHYRTDIGRKARYREA